MSFFNYNIVIVGLFTFLLIGCDSKVNEGVDSVEYQQSVNDDGYNTAELATGVAVGAVVGSLMTSNHQSGHTAKNQQRKVIAPVNKRTSKRVVKKKRSKKVLKKR